uniref:Mediator of RNA polymerase II transcription subunit 10 n=1 Tax=Chromera velia CCMP2878 TaxID=1169474 RepID=A0A0G4HR51_9ALVE|mmetsp:Transcript_38060/g.74786  ORF Transcript_38060/g.74786 Transcript_38060/m.74786 type:complete len:239 (-) Transcript_38060:213-929(-)|eukprot:Cvel_30410.t1-p1 / transcript=Cvel_30410.t1 / gene=Cvel_30410 / organism=Chromera_velia_CCMP2878 / gene_product=hypothetical protein / transcript_product=hypothetical protein / location=Cvel_scaffold4331:336-3282(+) / protein_length=238 / sequence_SO=supercontig / SO=protein_coding / is_pseudo=false
MADPSASSAAAASSSAAQEGGMPELSAESSDHKKYLGDPLLDLVYQIGILTQQIEDLDHYEPNIKGASPAAVEAARKAAKERTATSLGENLRSYEKTLSRLERHLVAATSGEVDDQQHGGERERDRRAKKREIKDIQLPIGLISCVDDDKNPLHWMQREALKLKRENDDARGDALALQALNVLLRNPDAPPEALLAPKLIQDDQMPLGPEGAVQGSSGDLQQPSQAGPSVEGGAAGAS